MTDAFTVEPLKDRGDLRYPSLRLLFDAWNDALRPGWRWPVIDDLIPPAQGVAGDHLWWLEQVSIDGRQDFIGRGFGQQTLINYGIDLTGQPVSEFARQPIFGRILRVLRAVVADPRPHHVVVDLSVMSQGLLHNAEALALPAARSDGTLWGVLGATQARPF